jgi:hypothetical protein
MRHISLPAHALRAMLVRLNSLSNEGHFSLDAEIIFLYLHMHCSGVTHISHMALTAHALEGTQVRVKSISNEGHFTLDAERFLERSSPRIAVR